MKHTGLFPRILAKNIKRMKHIPIAAALSLAAVFIFHKRKKKIEHLHTKFVIDRRIGLIYYISGSVL